MSLEQYFRSGIHRTILIRVVPASVAVAAAVAARKVAPHFWEALDTRATNSADPHHDQRLWFVYRRFQWGSPADSYNGEAAFRFFCGNRSLAWRAQAISVSERTTTLT
jgi:hypothetical protein